MLRTRISPVLNGQYQDGWSTSQNQMKNTCPFEIVYISFECIKFVRYSYQIIFFLLFLLAFTSADIISPEFLQLQFSISNIRKQIFITNFPVLTDSLPPPPPLTAKSAKSDKSFLLMLPKLYEIHIIKSCPKIENCCTGGILLMFQTV